MRAPEGIEEPRHELELAQGDQYVLCMAFSPDGKYLITISANEEHTIRIWDWRAKKLVDGGEAKGNKGTAPQEFGVEWNPFRGQPGQVSATAAVTPAGTGRRAGGSAGWPDGPQGGQSVRQ